MKLKHAKTELDRLFSQKNKIDIEIEKVINEINTLSGISDDTGKCILETLITLYADAAYEDVSYDTCMLHAKENYRYATYETALEELKYLVGEDDDLVATALTEIGVHKILTK